MYDITPLINAIFAVLGIIVTTVFVPYVKSRTTENAQREMSEWIKIAVTAAEQIYKGTGRGSEKKAYVVNWLSEHGISVDDKLVDNMIEAAVYELKTGLVK